MKEKESDIQRTILQYLRLKKYFCWKNHTTGVYNKQSGGFIPSWNVGAPDIFVVVKGQLYGIEVKTKKGKLSPGQKEWGEKLVAAGGVYLVARGLEDVQEVF